MAEPDLTASPRAPDDLDDIQALLRAGFADLTEARFLLLRIADPVAARAWLALAPITTVAALATKQPAALQIALTAAGMRALGVAEPLVAAFSAAFVGGLGNDAARSRRLGDIGPDAPANWDWGVGEGEPHVLVLLYALPGRLDAWQQECTASPAFAAGYSVLRALDSADMKGREPFGFLDGVSQPVIDWSGARTPGTDADLDYGNLIAPGEFVLGYRNEYTLLTERPLLDPAHHPHAADTLPEAPEAPALRDLGRNGTYLVFRQLHQDVRGFWQSMEGYSPGEPEALAERIVGRKRDGTPLEALQNAPISGVGKDGPDSLRNQFTYRGDPNGRVCPIGAHVRRANPRTGDMPTGRTGKLGQLLCLAGFGGHVQADIVAASRFHRLLRRGREYGEYITPEQALASGATDKPAGLHFICLMANISRQFEFIQNAWLQGSTFAGLAGEADPLTGNRAPLASGVSTDAFGLPETRLGGLPRFVGVRGGAYFFLPGLRALRYLVSHGAPPHSKAECHPL